MTCRIRDNLLLKSHWYNMMPRIYWRWEVLWGNHIYWYELETMFRSFTTRKATENRWRKMLYALQCHSFLSLPFAKFAAWPQIGRSSALARGSLGRPMPHRWSTLVTIWAAWKSLGLGAVKGNLQGKYPYPFTNLLFGKICLGGGVACGGSWFFYFKSGSLMDFSRCSSEEPIGLQQHFRRNTLRASKPTRLWVSHPLKTLRIRNYLKPSISLGKSTWFARPTPCFTLVVVKFQVPPFWEVVLCWTKIFNAMKAGSLAGSRLLAFWALSQWKRQWPVGPVTTLLPLSEASEAFAVA